jgi:hypothetical protein
MGVARYFVARCVDAPNLARVVIRPLAWKSRGAHHRETCGNLVLGVQVEESFGIFEFQ